MAKKEAKPNPLIGQVQLSTGTASTPYRVSDGNCLIIGGTADLSVVKERLDGQAVYPIETKDGKALMLIKLCDFQEADLGPHVELQYSYLVSRSPLTALKPHPFGILKIIANEPKVGLYADQVWNDTEPVIAYNNEYLGLNAHLCNGAISRDEEKGTKKFIFTDLDTGESLLEGEVSESPKNLTQTTIKLIRLMGIKNAFKFATRFWIKAKVINPIGKVHPENWAAETFLHAESVVVQPFDPNLDKIKFGNPSDIKLNFEPQFIEHMNKIKFVHLEPKIWEKEKKKSRFSFGK
ncbi:MAG: hypothetical protein HON98_09285 [Chloroflexi bacterium]|jgi:hypothetical protein|nr:hypothetical protein [Chloroflexota bacterium]MBT3668979.1 hypothetical protein [Chloroflexota bacterium]MBT4002827.1 hypothetical protein [Chloroflexota bacterium]MBT4304950.1 hypothetical protein [Chloroflexota bacterium]MBT4533287.1 hypothetical protein [Chloroflexota bacterium]